MEVVTCERCGEVSLGVGTLCIDCRCDDKETLKQTREKKLEQDELEEEEEEERTIKKRTSQLQTEATSRKTVDAPKIQPQERNSAKSKHKKERKTKQESSSDSDPEHNATKKTGGKRARGQTESAHHTPTRKRAPKHSSEQEAEEDSSGSQDELPVDQRERKAAPTKEAAKAAVDSVDQNENTDTQTANSRAAESSQETDARAERKSISRTRMGRSWAREWRGWTGSDWCEEEVGCERQAGERVRVEGLKATEFNGLLGTLKGGADGGRLRVVLDRYQGADEQWHLGKTLSRSLKSENLVFIAQPGATCRAARRAALYGTEFTPKKKKPKLGKREREAMKEKAKESGLCAPASEE